MSELTKRIIFGLVYIGLIVIATCTNNYFFSIIFLSFLLFCTYEFNQLSKTKSLIPYFLNGLPFLFFTLHVEYSFNLQLFKTISGYLIFTLFFLPFIIFLFSKEKKFFNDLSKIFLNFFYIGLPFIIINSIAEFNLDNKIHIILCVFILLWTNDTFAYLVGKNLGKHKLFERVSPNKTIEGFVGGIIFTLIAGYILSTINTNLEVIHWLILSVIISIFGTIGDLIESKFKREANIKDSSNLIPGHGGFLDRLDSFIFAIPFVFLFLSIIQ